MNMEVKEIRFMDRLSEVVEDILDDRIEIAATYARVVIIDHMSHSLNDLVNLDSRFDEVLEEATLEMVLAMSDQAPGMVGRSLTETVERFMSAHVRSQKESILADVVANLSSVSNQEAWSDND